MKTGLMIQADLDGENLQKVSVKRIHDVKNPSEWVQDEEFNIESAEKLIAIMVEGIITVIMFCHDMKIKDSSIMYGEMLGKMLESFAKPCKTNISEIKAGENFYKVNKNNNAENKVKNDMLTSIPLKDFGKLNRKLGLAIGTIESLLISTELSEGTKRRLKEVLLKLD